MKKNKAITSTKESEKGRTANNLKKLLKGEKEFIEGDIYLRLHRAISWLEAAELHTNELDIKFISLWIALNACYAIDNLKELGEIKVNERSSIKQFLTKINSKDTDGQLYNLLWQKYSSEIRLLLESKYVHRGFWDFVRGTITEAQFIQSFESSNQKIQNVFANGNVLEFLVELLKRLYELRNQVFHGCSTFNGRVNREQLNNACKILSSLVPILVEIMIQNKHDDWGVISYPVINIPS